jgi:GMP synthase-like glutamine amidotransferase
MNSVAIIQNCQAESAGTILDWLTGKDLKHSVYHPYKGDSFPSVTEHDATISLGCPVSARDYREHDYLNQLYQYIAGLVRLDRPYLGICFGGQMLAKVLGAAVDKNPVKEIGNYQVRLTESGLADRLFAGFPPSFPVFHWHGDTFRLPFGAALLAEGDDCRNQAFRAGNLVALQFHLEATDNDVPLWCDEYSEELAEFGKSESEIVEEYRQVADELRTLSFRLLDNFFA